MQNPAGLTMTNYHSQYDKLGSAMAAAAGMNMNVALGNVSGHSGSVVVGNPNHSNNHHAAIAAAAAAQMMTSANGQVVQHGGHVQSSHISSPYHSNGMNSPDKSLSPNGYEYGSNQRVLGSPPSPVNLHSPTSLLPTLNGLPATPSPAQLPPSPPTSSGHSGQGTTHPASSHSVVVSHSSLSSPETKVVASLAATPQQVTVLQAAVTPTQAAVAPTSAQTVTIVQAASAAVSNLTATIMSTPVAVVTNALQLQQQQQRQSQQQQTHSQPQNNNHNSHAKHATGSKHSINSSQSDSSATSGDELEEINTKDLAQRISAELKRYSIPQAIFAQRVLCRSQGTLSDLLRNPKPWSKLKSGRETFRRMSKWLEEPEFQRMSALRLAG